MTWDELERASDALREASEAASTDTLRTRLGERADATAMLAEKERKPDHGRLAREDSILVETLADADADDEVHERVESARDEIKEFRKDVPGV